ncbi:site-specific integrase [Methylobacterium sp. J-059]|uniref:site-specific integrase n=1 Tax=Methylobacterium sp. J-059 TaxID=2836643 RepID=UPI001FB880CF|nr:site-specific integrase [Methylobacterium sp. J-059]MCJ2040416.1 site-specific integrase [Methylobacterium sp. J-059]
MQRHAFRTDSRIHQIQARVPTDVAERLRGMHVAVVLPAMRSDPEAILSLKLSDRIKGSLHTRDDVVATARRLRVLEHLERIYDQVRKGGSKLNHRQLVGLAGDVYQLLRANFDDDPGTPEMWSAWKAFVRAAREGRIPTAPTITPGELADERAEAARLFGPDLTAGIDAMPPSGDRAALEDRCGRLTLWVLQQRGLHVDRATRIQLLEHVADACLDAGLALKRAAAGDYTPDPKASRFPPFEGKASGITLSELFDRWKAETKPAGSTETTWRGIVTAFAKHLGHDDAARVTDRDVVAFKDARVAAGRAAKTINDSDLACLRALYRFGVSNKRLKTNPAEGVKVSAKAKAGMRKLPYEDAELARLLALCAAETHPARRFLPLILATSGARVAEVAQLWAEKVREIDGVPCMELEPAVDGGNLKTAWSERVVPLHPAVLESGFLDFVAQRGTGPLFYKHNRSDTARHASKGVSNHLASWIRQQGFNNPRKAPNHALRHWFKSAAPKIGMLDSVADHIQGHAPKTEGGTYRHFDMKTLARAVASIPIPTASCCSRRDPDDNDITSPDARA